MTRVTRGHGHYVKVDGGTLCTECYCLYLLPDETMIICKECGKRDNVAAWMKGSISFEEGLCFHCKCWQDLVARFGPASVIVEGDHYLVDLDEPIKQNRGQFMGFAGAHWKIEFFDGRVVETNDLWHQGTIPAWYRDRLPDTARFVRNNQPRQEIPNAAPSA